MLFTDGDPVSQASLTIIDPEVGIVAAANPRSPLIIEGPGSLIRYAMEEAGSVIQSKYQNFSSWGGFWGGNWPLYTGAAAANSPRISLNMVVTKEPNPTKVYMIRWLELFALSRIYRAAYRRITSGSKDQGTDRYGEKMKMYKEDADSAWAVVESNGLPYSQSPLSAPGAIRELNSGVFGPTNVSASGTGSGDSGGTYSVAITYVYAPTYGGPANPNNGESAPSVIEPVTVTSGEYISVSIIGLNPPTQTGPQYGIADGGFPRSYATGWNVYVGASATSMYLQNSTPIPIATTAYTLAAIPVYVNGLQMGVGQWSDQNATRIPVFNRV